MKTYALPEKQGGSGWIWRIHLSGRNLFLLPEYQPACWMDEWLEPEVPLDEVQKEYVGKPDPKGQNPQYTAACCGDRVLKVCTLLIRNIFSPAT